MHAATASFPQHTVQRYSDLSDLNKIRVCLPHPPSYHYKDGGKIWIIYVHGGAWRDPTIDASSFDALQASLLQSKHLGSIAGLASIDYRLSPYPSHPTEPSDPHDPSRNASHPDHINDVLHALLYVQQKYAVADQYILVGHSCGATLALQAAMRRYWGSQYESTFAEELNVLPPIAIVGAAGIYDLEDLLLEYAHEPAYRDFVVNAFGSDSTVWKQVSPSSGDYTDSWTGGRHLLIIESDSDELISGRQAKLMYNIVRSSGWSQRLSLHHLVDLKHDDVWRKPAQLAHLIDSLLDDIVGSEA